MLITKDELSIQLETMIQRFQQLTNPEENQDQIYFQQLLTNLVREEDQQMLLKNINHNEAIQDETVLLLEQKLN